MHSSQIPPTRRRNRLISSEKVVSDEGTGEKMLQGWDEDGRGVPTVSGKFCLEPSPQEKLTFEPFSAAKIPELSASLNRLQLLTLE